MHRVWVLEALFGEHHQCKVCDAYLLEAMGTTPSYV
jgi:hypothetical protein